MSDELRPLTDEENITNKIQAKKKELEQTDLTEKQRLRLIKEIVVLREDEKHIHDADYKFPVKKNGRCPVCRQELPEGG